MVLRAFLESHDDHIDLLYLTDIESSLQVIHKWIDGGSKLNLSKSSDTDVLKSIVLKFKTTKESGNGGNDSDDRSQGPPGGPLE